jgi:hypothetical protein
LRGRDRENVESSRNDVGERAASSRDAARAALPEAEAEKEEEEE